jgi:TRAP transporter TAXI family solute receptor
MMKYKNKIKRGYLKNIAIVTALVIFQLLLANTNFAADKTVFINVAAGSPGTSYYAFSAPMGGLIDQHAKNPAIKATVSTSGGGVSNTRLLISKETDIASTMANVAWKAANGLAPFKQKANLRAILAGEMVPFFLVVPDDSSIKTIKDVAGKRMTAGDPGGGTQILFKELMKVLGISFKESDMVYMTHGEGKDALADGKVDAWFSFLSANMDALAARKKIRLISFSDDELNTILTKMPYFSKSVLPAGVLKDVGESIVISVPSLWICRPELDANVVYQIVKIICEHKDVIRKSHRNSRLFDAQFSANSKAVPYHEGALKYYKEVGAM